MQPIACATLDVLESGAESGRYSLHAWCIMANHVHILLTPNAPVERIVHYLRRKTAQHANKLLGRIGKTFWAPAVYEHSVRSPAEFHRIVVFIENDPVETGLVLRPTDYPWSSALARHNGNRLT